MNLRCKPNTLVTVEKPSCIETCSVKLVGVPVAIAELHRIDRDHRAMTRHDSTSPQTESLVLPATISLALTVRPTASATISSPDHGHPLGSRSHPVARFQPADARSATRSARPTTGRKPKSP